MLNTKSIFLSFSGECCLSGSYLTSSVSTNQWVSVSYVVTEMALRVDILRVCVAWNVSKVVCDGLNTGRSATAR